VQRRRRHTQFRRWLNGRHFMAHRGESCRIPPCSGADVQDPTWSGWNQVADMLMHVGERYAFVLL